MSPLLESLSASWIAMGFLKALALAAAGTAFIACIRQRKLAASLWAVLMLLLPVAFFSGLMPVSLKALPKPLPEPVTSRPTAMPLPAPSPASVAEPIAIQDAVAEVKGTTEQASVALASPFVSPAESRAVSREQCLVCLWLAGGVMTLLPGLRALVISRRLRRFAAPAEIHDLWQEVAGDISGFVPVRISGDIEAPGVISAWRPEVLLPAGALEWTPERLASVLRHEFHHVHRRDLQVRWLGRIVRALLWFHPATWWVQSRMVLAQERAADESVVISGVPAADYAGHLLETASGSTLFPGIPMARRSQLGGRIHVLLSRTAYPGSFRRGLESCAAMAFTVLAMLAALLGFAVPETTQAAGPGLITDKGLRGPILDRHGKIIATSDPAAMPAELRGKPPLRWYPDGPAIASVSGLVTPDQNAKLNAIEGTGLECVPHLANGKSLESTIDLRIQRLAWKELEQAKLPGSIIVMDPRNGEVLALASWPSIDPNDYADGVAKEQLDAWQDDEQEPLSNRAFTMHPPAFFAKLILSLAAAKNGMSDRIYFCGPQHEMGRLKVIDTHPANVYLGLPTAITRGSNVYFAQLAQEMGHQKAGEIWTDIVTPRREGFPWRAPASVWLPSDQKDTVENLGIATLGSGMNEVSLLDVATITSAVAAGTVHEPSYVLEERGRPPVSLAELGIPEGDLQAIREALHRNVNDIGTASRAKLEGIAVAGLPFTAMEGRPGWGAASSREIFASFAGYTPSDKPRYTVAIRLSGPGTSETSPFYGGTVAAPMAARLLRAIFAEIE